MFDLTTKTGLSQSVDHSACLSVPIKLSSDASFCERQSNVFSALDNLEVVHTRVTEETEAERMAVSRAAWRHTVTAPEDLVEQKRRVSFFFSIVKCLIVVGRILFYLLAELYIRSLYHNYPVCLDLNMILGLAWTSKINSYYNPLFAQSHFSFI